MEAAGKTLPAGGASKAPRAPPRGTEAVWEAYVALDATRAAGFNGPQSISYAEMEAYSRLSDIRLEPWEVRAIVALDRVYAEVQAEGAT